MTGPRIFQGWTTNRAHADLDALWSSVTGAGGLTGDTLAVNVVHSSLLTFGNAPHFVSPIIDSGGLTITSGGMSITGAVSALSGVQVPNAVYFTGLTTGAVQHRLIGLDASNNLQIGLDADPVNVTGNFSVGTNKFTVATSTGNAAVAGTLGVTGAAVFSSTITLGNGVTKALQLTRNTGPTAVPTLYYDVGTDDLSLELGGNILRWRDTGSGVPMSITSAGVLTALSTITGTRVIGGADIASATAFGVFSDGHYDTTFDVAITLAHGAVVAHQSAATAATVLNFKTQVDMHVANSGSAYASHNVAVASHTSGTTGSVFGVQGAIQCIGAGGTTNNASAFIAQMIVRNGATAGNITGFTILAPSISGGTVTGNTTGIAIGNMGSSNTQFALTSGTGLWQLGDQLITAQSTTSRASIRFATGGAAPSAPIEGEFWYDGTHLAFRDSTTTHNLF